MKYRTIDRWSQQVLSESTDNHSDSDHLVVLQGLEEGWMIYDTRTNKYLPNPYEIFEEVQAEQKAIREAQERLQHQFNLESAYYVYSSVKRR